MDLRAGLPARVVALATTAYSVAITVAPKVLATPTGMTTLTGSVPKEVAELTRSIGTRDAALSIALAVAPAGRPMRILTAARVVSDAADAIWFGRLAKDRSMLLKISGVALGWALLEAVVGFTGSAAKGAHPNTAAITGSFT